jgi:hypothetical protein
MPEATYPSYAGEGRGYLQHPPIRPHQGLDPHGLFANDAGDDD